MLVAIYWGKFLNMRFSLIFFVYCDIMHITCIGFKMRTDDRRKINRFVGIDKRGTKVDRRKCPKCKGILDTKTHRIKLGTKITTICIDCGYMTTSEQIDSQNIE